MGTMKYVELMVYAFLIIVTSLLAMLLGPDVLVGYIAYLLGWSMVGSGFLVIGDLYFNPTYLLAIYPLAYYAHMVFWSAFLTINNLKKGGNINNLLVRLITFIPVAILFVFLWYVAGHMLMSYALKTTVLNTDMLNLLAWLNETKVSFWGVMAMTIVTYVIFFVKILAVIWKREGRVEGLVR